VVVIVALIGLVSALLLMRPTNSIQQLEPTPSAAPDTTSPMQQRITNLKQEIRAADPSLDALPLPPVDLELQLEKK
jgi:hypothetical protein